MSVDYSQLVEFRDKFQIATNEFESFLKKFLLRQALDVLRKTKGDNHPIITSRLINGWTLSDVVKQADKLVVTISNSVEYASFVEYGHMSRGDKKWVDGQFLCTVPLIEINKKMPQRFASSFNIWLAEKMR